MANPEHLQILKQGVEVWNEWKAGRFHNEVDLTEANLYKAELDDIDFTGVDLSGADLYDAKLIDADLWAAYLCGADLRRASLKGANLLKAQVNDADLSEAQLSNAVLSNANLSRAKLVRANLIGTDFYGAYLQDADFSLSRMDLTILANTDLSVARGLDSIRHYGPSIIGIDTLYKSRGNISNKFLRGCGVPESFILQIPALVASSEPIQFYKCFISFTEADDLFSERLYNDLQGAGVRCWRWKEDAQWGKTLMRSIDEAVRLYDKLVVICSEQSLNSPAVIREIERALQKEDDLARRGKDSEVLFPIRLDDYIFAGWNHHHKADVIAKNVGDFRKWNEPEQYQKAFNRLLRDLKAEEKKDVK